MERYGTLVRDGSLYVETSDEPLEIGSVESIVELAGGESYEIVYEDDYAHAVDWLELDEEDTMTIDVLDTIEGFDFPGQFVQKLEQRDHESGGQPSERTRYFVEIMTEIWDNKGNLDHLEENPFQ